MREIAEKLKALRLANRMTLKQLASKAGCTDAYLSQLERGRANPSIMILKKVASALQMKVVNFFLEPETKENDVVCKEGERVNIRFKQGMQRFRGQSEWETLSSEKERKFLFLIPRTS